MTSLAKLLIRFTFLIIVLLLMLFIWFKFLKPNENIVTTTIHQSTILQEITSMGKLELVKYNLKDVVEYQKEQTSYQTINRFLPKARAVLIVSGEAIGCLDLTLVNPEDVYQGTDTLFVYLPHPELCVHKINHQNSKVYDVSNGYFVEQGQMVDEAYQAAEKQIFNSAIETGILEQTKENAYKILKPFLERVSSKKVVLKWHNQPS